MMHGLLTTALISQQRILEVDLTSPQVGVKARACFLRGQVADAAQLLDLDYPQGATSATMRLSDLASLFSRNSPRPEWEHSVAHRPQEDLYRGRSVALVGPGPIGALQGEHIDSFDVVVRVKHAFPGEGRSRNSGSRCDVVYANARTAAMIAREIDGEESSNRKPAVWVGARALPGANAQVIASMPLGFRLICARASIFIRALVEILSAGVSNVGVFGMTLYLGGSSATERLGYQRLRDHFPWEPLSVGFANHDLLSQKIILSELSKNPAIELGDETRHVADLDMQDFATQLTEEYSTW
jgi:hypothetical protein